MGYPIYISRAKVMAMIRRIRELTEQVRQCGCKGALCIECKGALDLIDTKAKAIWEECECDGPF